MAKDKIDSQNFAQYEYDNIKGALKKARDLANKKKQAQLILEENTKIKEKSTYATIVDTFKEAWKFSPTDLKRTVGYKAVEASLSSVAPYVNSLLFGSLNGLAGGVNGAITKFASFAGLSVARDRIADTFRFKAKISEQVLNDSYTNSITANLSKDVLSKPRPYFKANAPAALQGIINQVAVAKTNLLKTSISGMNSAIIFIGCTASLMAVNPTLGVGVLATTAITSRFGGFINAKFRKKNRKVNDIKTQTIAKVSDTIKNTPLVQDTNQVFKAGEDIKFNLNKASKMQQKVTYARSQAYLYMRTTVTLAMQAGIMGAICYDVMKTGDIGRFALISQASWMTLNYGSQLAETWTQLQTNRNDLNDATKKLLTPVELDRQQGNEKLSKDNTKVSIKNITFAYPQIKDIANMSVAELEDRERAIVRGSNALENINTDFDKGQLTAVIGKSGHGKSTLMSLMRHDYDVQDGQIMFGDKDVKDLSDEQLNSHISFVDQNVHFLQGTIRENLKFFNQNATQEDMMKACKMAGFDSDVKRFDDGLDNDIGQDGANLSGGQRQRLALARAFLTDTPILILDEPTTGLDPELSKQVIFELKKLSKEKTVIIVTHNPEEIASSDRCVVVNEGKIIADGKTRDLAKSNSFVAKIVNDRVEISPYQEINDMFKAETSGKPLNDMLRDRKAYLLKEHKDIFVKVRKHNVEKQRVQTGKDVKKGDYVQKLDKLNIVKKSR